MPKKTKKTTTRIGRVSINTGGRGQLVLRFTYHGKQRSFSPGLIDNPVNRNWAVTVAQTISNDILSNQLDTTNLKYAPYRAKPSKESKKELTLSELLDAYTKAKSLAKGSLAKFNANRAHILKKLDHAPIDIDYPKLSQYRTYLESKQKVSPKTARTYISQIKSILSWARLEKLTELPPDLIDDLTRIINQIKVPKRKAKSLTKTEVQAILSAFKQTYPKDIPYIRFQLGTGARGCEAIALTWADFNIENKSVTVSKSFAHGVLRQKTKTGKDRVVHLSDAVFDLLIQLRNSKSNPKPTDLIFKNVGGGRLNLHKFRERWVEVSQSLGIDSTPYIMRHTAISHALEAGANPVKVAAQVGNSIEILLSTYAHCIKAENVFVEF